MMRATETGIEWARIREEDLEGLVAAVKQFAVGCVHSHDTGRFGTVYGHSHYTTKGGETICPKSAIYGLQSGNSGPDYYGFQAPHVATIRAALKNAHKSAPKVTEYLVREEVAA